MWFPLPLKSRWAVAGDAGRPGSQREVPPRFRRAPRPSGGTAPAPQRLPARDRGRSFEVQGAQRPLSPGLPASAPAARRHSAGPRLPPGAPPASQPDGVLAGPGSSVLFPGPGHECDPPQGRGRGTPGMLCSPVGSHGGS